MMILPNTFSSLHIIFINIKTFSKYFYTKNTKQIVKITTKNLGMSVFAFYFFAVFFQKHKDMHPYRDFVDYASWMIFLYNMDVL